MEKEQEVTKQEVWLLDIFDQLRESDYWGKWTIEWKSGKIVLMRFERTELPPKELDGQ
jgi:hypothetical protein